MANFSETIIVDAQPVEWLSGGKLKNGDVVMR